MEKSLKTIQVLAKIGRILSKIVWICCIVGVVGCAVGIVSLAIGVEEIFKIGGFTIHGIIEMEAGMSIGSMYASLSVAMILCIGELIIAVFSERYFKNELAAGTPFTIKGADEMKNLGVLSICISLATIIAADITYLIMKSAFKNVMDMNMDDYASVGIGIAFLIMSVVFRYGAEIISRKSA